MQKLNFNIYYEGEKFEDGKIDVKELAPSLLALGEILEEANKVVNKDKADLKIYIKADFQKKCFKVNLSLESNIVQDIKNMLGIKDNLSLQELVELIGFIEKHPVGVTTSAAALTSFVAYKLWQKGRKVKKYRSLESGNIELEIEEEKREVSVNLFGLVKWSWSKKSKIQKNFEKHASAGETAYSINNSDDSKRILSEEERRALIEFDHNLSGEPEMQDPIRTNLLVRMPDYYGEKKWMFTYVGRAIEPELSDHVKEKIKELRMDITYNTKLPVEMIVEFEKDNDGKIIEGTEKYKITKITGDLIQEVKHSDLFDKKKS
jgi:hypothetical protein